MAQQADHTYYLRHYAEELKRGQDACNEAVMAVHYELALRYSAVVAQFERIGPDVTLAVDRSPLLAP